MHWSSFWVLVDFFTLMWPTEPIRARKKQPRPIYQQLAVALDVLESAEGEG